MNPRAYDKPSEGATSASIAVVIPHLSGDEHTEACFRSLDRQTIPPARVLIVNNGSPQAPASFPVKGSSHYKSLELPENRGYAAAVNTGIREALTESAVTHIWVLNKETICPPDTLAKLLAAIEATPKNGLAGCPMIKGNGRSGETAAAAGKNLIRPWMIPGAATSDEIPDYLSGACLLIKRQTIEDVGLFDEGFFFVFEDADYSLRSKQAGWNLVVARDALIEHRRSATARRHTGLQSRAYRSDHIRLLRKYTHHPLLLGFPPFICRLVADALRANLAATFGNFRGLFSSLNRPAPGHVVQPLWHAPPVPPEVKSGINVLYASHQQGKKLPGYIRFALTCLSEAGYNTTLITTQQDLDEASRSFLTKQGVKFFPTENRGFDFGMWRRYLAAVPPGTLEQWTRILLINDSVIYFRNRFDEFIRLAEAHPADAISLSSNKDYGFHLQSYFLYLKPAAINVFEAHVSKSKDVHSYWDAVMNFEVAFSRKMIGSGLTIAPLFKTNRSFDFCYEFLIESGLGFIKRKLLVKRHTFGQTLNFLRRDRRALDLDYKKLIHTHGKPDDRFDVHAMCPDPSQSAKERTKYFFWRFLFWGWWLFAEATILASAVAIGIYALTILGSGPAIVLTLMAAVSGHLAMGMLRLHILKWSVRTVKGIENT